MCVGGSVCEAVSRLWAFGPAVFLTCREVDIPQIEFIDRVVQVPVEKQVQVLCPSLQKHGVLGFAFGSGGEHQNGRVSCQHMYTRSLIKHSDFVLVFHALLGPTTPGKSHKNSFLPAGQSARAGRDRLFGGFALGGGLKGGP